MDVRSEVGRLRISPDPSAAVEAVLIQGEVPELMIPGTNDFLAIATNLRFNVFKLRGRSFFGGGGHWEQSKAQYWIDSLGVEASNYKGDVISISLPGGNGIGFLGSRFDAALRCYCPKASRPGAKCPEGSFVRFSER